MSGHKEIRSNPVGMEPVFTIKEAAAWAKVNSKTISRWIKEERLQAQRIGRVIRIKRSELERLVSAA